MQKQKQHKIKLYMMILIIIVSAMTHAINATTLTIHATRHKLRVYSGADDAAQSVGPSDSTTTIPAGQYRRASVSWNSEILCDFNISGLSGITIDSVDLAYKVSALSAGTDSVFIYQCTQSWTAPVQHADFGTSDWANTIESEVCNGTGWRTFSNSANMKTLLQGWIDGDSSNYGIIVDNVPRYQDYEIDVQSVKLVVYYEAYGDKHKANNTTALNQTGSWVEAIVPTQFDTAVWDNTVTAANTVSLGANQQWKGIKIENPGGTVIVQNNTLTLGSGGIDMSSATQDLEFDSDIALGANQVWNVASDKKLRLRGGLTGAYSIDKQGAGTLYYQDDIITYSGGTTVSGGTLQIGSSGTQGVLPGNVTNNGVVRFKKSNNYSYSGAISGTGSVDVDLTDTLTFTSVQTYSGATTVSSGVLNMNVSGNPADNGLYNSSSITVNSGAAIKSSATNSLYGYGTSTGNTLTLNGTAEITTADNVTTQLRAPVTMASGGVISSGTPDATYGSWEFDGDITVTGTDTAVISASDAAWGSDSRTFTISDAAGVLNVTGDFDHPTTFTGSMTKTGSGTMILNSASTYTGTTNISGGVLRIKNQGALGTTGSNTTVNSGTALEIDGNFITTNSVDEPLVLNGTGISSGGALRNISNEADVDGTINLATNSSIGNDAGNFFYLFGVVSGSGTLTKVGTGPIVLKGTNTYTAATTISSGSMWTDNNSGLGTTAGNTTVNSGASLAIYGGVSSAEPLVLNGSGSGGSGAIYSSSGNNTLSGTVLLNSATEIGVAADNVDMTGVISGSGSLTKINSGGDLTLKGDNTYTGATIVSAGILWPEHKNALGNTSANTTVESGAELGVWTGDTIAEPLVLNGTGISGGGALKSYSNTNYMTGTINLASNASINNSSSNYFYINGVVSGSGDLTKVGTGSMVFKGNNTYTGNTNIQAGSIWIYEVDGLGTTDGNTTIDSGASVALNTAGGTISESFVINGPGKLSSGVIYNYSGEHFITGTINVASNSTILNASASFLYLDGVVSGSGDILKDGAGPLVLRGDNTYTGATTISEDVVWIRHNNALGNSSSGTSVASGTSLILYNSISIPEPLTINGVGDGSIGALVSNSGNNSTSGDITMGSASTISAVADTFTISGAISGAYALTKIGSGKLILSGNNTYSGATSINAGIVRVQHANGLGTSGSATTVASGTALEVLGGISSPEPLTVSGTGIATDGAILSVSGSNTVSGNITLSTDVNIGVAADDLTLSGVLSGLNKAVTKVGAGTLIYSGINTYTGNTTVSAGELRVNGETDNASAVSVSASAVISGTGTIGEDLTISGNGIIEPGDNGAGKLTAAGNVIFNSTSVMNVDLGTSSDTLAIAGNLTIDGTVNITAGAGFDVGTYTVITYSGSLTNNTMDVGTVPNGYVCSLAVTGSTIDLIITSTNNDPTAIALSSSNVNEGQASGTVIGVLTTTDLDSGDSHTYSLPGGVLGNDNFSIDADSLETGTIFDYENGEKTFEVSIQTDDGNGGTFLDTFTITINNALTGSGTSNEIDYSNSWQIGGGTGDTRQLSSDKFFDGHLDEIRIESGMRSADWIKFCYETQKIGQTAVTFQMGEEIDLLPLTVTNNIGTGTSDTIMVYTDSFTIIFDEDQGGGIKWLSPASNKGGSNQVTESGNVTLFDIRYATNSYNNSGVLTLLESNTLFAKVKQEVTLSSVEFDAIYTVYGDGKIFIDIEAHNRSGSDQTNTLYFSTFRDVSGTASRITSTGSASTSDFILNADNGADQFDILLSPFGLWSDASGFDNGENTESRLGYIDGSRTLKDGYQENWSLLLDFRHKTWNDTTDDVHYYTDAYQTPDSLAMNRGTYRMTKAWEEKLLLHYNFDQDTTGSADGDTVDDYSEANPTLYNGIIEGGTWTSGKWGDGALTLASADSIAVINASNFNNKSVFTITGWIKKSGTGETDALIFGDDGAATSGFKLVSDADKLKLVYAGTTLIGNTALGTGWRFVAATADVHKGWLKLFVDGRIDTTFYNVALNFTNGTGNVSIGNGFAGDLDDIRIYSKEISEETIYAMYNNSYRAGQGMYSVRCDNNSSIDVSVDGSSILPRFNPIFEIANYWGTSKPDIVYYNGQWLTDNTDYISYLDDTNNRFYIGFKKAIRLSNLRFYIDDHDSTGAHTTGPTKKMVWGTSGDDFYVQNFEGTTFGSGDDQYYLKFTMPAAGYRHGGEIGEVKSSAISPSAAVSSAINTLDNDSADRDITLGCYDNLMNNTKWVKTAYNINAKPTYTVLESSSVRVKLQVDTRTAENTESFDIKTIWTIYPTGQLFRYDSIANLSSTITTPFFDVGQRWESGVSFHASESNYYGGIFGGSSIHDFAVAMLSGTDNGGVNNFFEGYSDTIFFKNSDSTASDFVAVRFRGTTNQPNTSEPYKLIYYIDIAHQNMSNNYIDSVCLGARNIVFDAGDMTVGTRLTNTWGDLDQDGFNESEGCYTVQASNNTIDFKIEADAATDRPKFYPAIKISNYYSSYKPAFVHLYTASDTATLIEGYQYNCYLNKAADELVIQLDTVLTADVNCYISDDDDLAVTLSEFDAEGFDEYVEIKWRTESELENAGFNLYRRVSPGFYRSIVDKVENGDTICNPCKVVANEDVWDEDTLWMSLNQRLIPGAEGGNSFGPLDYDYEDDDVFNFISYDYILEAVDFANIRDTFGPITVTPVPEIDLSEEADEEIRFIAVPNPVLIREGRLDFYLASEGDGEYTITVFDNTGTLIFSRRGNYLSEGKDPDKLTSWDLKYKGRLIGAGSYIAILNYETEYGYKRTKKLLLGIKR